jgi:hypothetical protein
MLLLREDNNDLLTTSRKREIRMIFDEAEEDDPIARLGG